MSSRLDVTSAIDLMVGTMRPTTIESVGSAAAIDRILSKDLHAPFPLPPWTNASMDGFAVRASDITDARSDNGITLTIAAISRTGGATPPVLQPGQAIRIFTGAELPVGADSVVRQEDTRYDSSTVTVLNSRDARANVRARGGDLAEGGVALRAGDKLTAGALAIVAAFGISELQVYHRPRVGILVTGDEVVPATEHSQVNPFERLADVNSPMLANLVTQAGGIARPLGIVADDRDAIMARIGSMTDLDLLITAGGISVGDHDHLPAVIQSLNATTHFRGVTLRPGGPTTFATLRNGLPWLALPGNPVSAFVTFHLFGHSAIRALAGARQESLPLLSMRCAQNVPRDRVLDQYLRVTLSESGDEAIPEATLTGHQGSGMLHSIARADALMIVKAGDGAVERGEVVRGIML